MPKTSPKRRRRSAKQRASIGRTGWGHSSDPVAQARRLQRGRLRMHKYDPQDDVAALVSKFLRKNRATQCKPGWALGAHRSGVEILEG